MLPKKWTKFGSSKRARKKESKIMIAVLFPLLHPVFQRPKEGKRSIPSSVVKKSKIIPSQHERWVVSSQFGLVTHA